MKYLLVLLAMYCTGAIGTLIGMMLINIEKPNGLTKKPFTFDVVDYLTIPWGWPLYLVRFLMGKRG